jgi:hypothetical protein
MYVYKSTQKTETTFIYWGQLSNFQLKTESIQFPKRHVEDMTIDNVQNCDSYINILSSQTYRS